jgi:dinuclear metal center YbgI/SA1388 family protein
VTVPLHEIRSYLDGYLAIAETPDEANAWNGLQVENPGQVGCLVAAVDGSQATIDGVVGLVKGRGAPLSPLLLVHHGLFWDGTPGVTDRRYRRLQPLLEHGIALYAAHIPLDVHPEVGNNAVLARELGLRDLEPYDDYRGIRLGMAGSLEGHRDRLVERLDALLGTRARLLPGGPAETRRIGIITGAAGGRIGAAVLAGCDTFVTGEGAHHTYFDAMELGINVIYAGHYATEQLGVKELARHLAKRFDLPWEFHDHPTGM